VLAQFFPASIDMNKRKAPVNELRGFVAVAGMLPIKVIAQRGRLAMRMAAEGVPDKVEAQVQGQALLHALGLCFPNGSAMMSNILDMDSVDLDMVQSGGGLMVNLTAQVNMVKVRELYPSMETLLNHLAEYVIAVVDACEPGASPHVGVETAKSMMGIRLHHAHGGLIMTMSIMFEQVGGASAESCKGGRLLWFNPVTRKPVPHPDSKLARWPIEFDEVSPGAKAQFRVVVDGTFRIPQLGCGNISMPLIVCSLEYQASAKTYEHPYESGEAPACRFVVKVLHVGEKKLTTFLLRPFFNLDLLRFILVTHFKVQFELGPDKTVVEFDRPATGFAAGRADDRPAEEEEDTEDDEFFDAAAEPEPFDTVSVHEEIVMSHQPPSTPARFSTRPTLWDGKLVAPWRFAVRMHMFMPPPPRVVTACLSMFVGEQMASPDDVQLMIDLLTAVAIDLRGVAARLARLAGNEGEAETAERDARNAAARAKESRQQIAESISKNADSAAMQGSGSRGWWWWRRWTCA
jgi:hypothetical protein